MKIIKLLFLLILILLIITIAVLSYFGFVPFLSSVFGSDRPRDLGVKYAQQQYNDYLGKSKEQIIKIEKPVAPSDSIAYEGKQDLTASFTQEEISARINYSKWKYMPVKNVQIRINNDGSVEFSGVVVYSRLDGFIQREGAGGYSKADIEKGLSYIKLLGRDFPVYAKFKASMKDNQLSETTDAIEVGRFSVPLGMVKADSTINNVAMSIMQKAPMLYVKSVNFENGKMNFSGTIPEKIYSDQ